MSMTSNSYETPPIMQMFVDVWKWLRSSPQTHVFRWDVPHELEVLQDKYSGRDRQMPCYLDPNATCYSPQKKLPEVELYQTAICPKPMSINSGSHKTIFDLTLRGERFAIAVEEMESFFCTFEGEKIIIGAATTVGKGLLATHEFPIDLLEKAIESLTGTRPMMERVSILPNYDSRPGMDKPIIKDRFKIEVVPIAEIMDRGCDLTLEAKGCALFIFD